jgi:hypothetical protein
MKQNREAEKQKFNKSALQKEAAKLSFEDWL